MFEKIKDLCEKSGVTITQLEKDLGWKRSIYKWDTNRPSIDKVKAVADYFGVTVDYLLSDRDTYDEKEELLEKAFSGNSDMKVLFSVAEKCSSNEIKTAIRLIQALRGDDVQ